MSSFKKRVYEVLSPPKPGDRLSRWFDVFIINLIALNVLAVILETVPAPDHWTMPYFALFDLISVSIFSVEYLARLWACTVDPRFSEPLRGRWRFATHPMMLIDLLAILPFFLPFFLKLDLRFVRVLRLFRLFRLFKLGRYARAILMLGRVITRRKEQLLITLFLVVVLLIFASSVMYYVETSHAEARGVSTQFSSIPASMWWGVTTMTTVGYGDIYPLSPQGRVIGGMLAVLGVGLFALPAGIIASGFAEEMSRERRHRKRETQVLNTRAEQSALIGAASALGLEPAALNAERFERLRAFARHITEHPEGAGAFPCNNCPHCGRRLSIEIRVTGVGLASHSLPGDRDG